MKHVELLIGRSGPGGSFPPGAVIEVDDAEAGRIIAAGHAREVSKGEEPEKATAPSGEVAVKPKAKRKAKRSVKKK